MGRLDRTEKYNMYNFFGGISNSKIFLTHSGVPEIEVCRPKTVDLASCLTN